LRSIPMGLLKGDGHNESRAENWMTYPQLFISFIIMATAKIRTWQLPFNSSN